MAPGDDDFTLVRKSYRDLMRIQRRTAQLANQNSEYGHVNSSLIEFKAVLVKAAQSMGREDDL
jgi:hypothetical protein